MAYKFGMYGQAVIKAVEYYKELIRISKMTPKKALLDSWEKAIKECTDSKTNQDKGCPKCAFLGLCEEGYVNGIPKPSIGFPYTTSVKNKAYAIEAAKILLNSRSQPDCKYDEIWKKVREIVLKQFETVPIKQQGAMNVVFALKAKGMLNWPKDM
ncbi:MAG: hypothetical protein J7K40_12445 [candidate division Zixibacteria bacterium]|nr:hypothetical protein [candidate division Zixibacteria bacterium]